MHVLLVEDDRAVREAIADALGAEGFAVTDVADGEQALAALDGGLAADVVLLDLMMPIMSGPELFARLKRDERFASLPVVVLSAVSELTRLQTQADATLPKPVDLGELIETLHRVAGRPSHPTR